MASLRGVEHASGRVLGGGGWATQTNIIAIIRAGNDLRKRRGGPATAFSFFSQLFCTTDSILYHSGSPRLFSLTVFNLFSGAFMHKAFDFTSFHSFMSLHHFPCRSGLDELRIGLGEEGSERGEGGGLRNK